MLTVLISSTTPCTRKFCFDVDPYRIPILVDPPEPFEYTVLNPKKPIVEPENKEEGTTELEPAKTIIEPEDEERFKQTMESVDVPKVQERKPQTQTTGKSKGN